MTLDASRKQITLMREQVNDKTRYGVVASSGTPRIINLTSENHLGDPNVVQSQTAKANLLPGGEVRTGISATGAINVEMSPGPQMNELLELGFGGLWQTPVDIDDATISFLAADNSINATTTDLFQNVPVGAWISIGNTTNPNNTGRAKVTEKPDNQKLICAYIVFTDEAADATQVSIDTVVLRNGTDFISTTMERRQLDDSTTPYEGYTGLVCNSFTLTCTFQEIITASFDFLSQGPRAKSATSLFSGLSTPSAPEPIEDSLSDASNHMRAFRTGGVLDGNVSEFTIEHGHSVTPVDRCQEVRASSMSLGTKTLGGNLNGYLIEGDGRPTTAYDFGTTSFDVEIVPDSGPIYIFTVFRARFTGMGDTAKESNEGPVALNLPWTGQEDPSTPNTWLQVCRIDR